MMPMMPTKARRSMLCALLALAGLGMQPARADAVAEFYKGKTISVVVSSAAGGGYDAMARAIARFIGRHMPGNPTFIVQNMPGAGGILAMNYLYNVAAKDGTVIGLVQNNTPFEPLFGTKDHGRHRRQFHTGLLCTAPQRYARHQNQAHQRLSRAERRFQGHGKR
jgi:hypothetical protein